MKAFSTISWTVVVLCMVTANVLLAADSPKLPSKAQAQFTLVSESIHRASTLTLYEGLPHQTWERDLLAKELAAKKTVNRHNFPFYERVLPVEAADTEPLRRLCADAESFNIPGSLKPCGGFHPDYCLVWQDGESTCELLICFGCHEMRLYGLKLMLPADIRDDAFKQFETILKKYQAQRPRINEKPLR